MPIHAAADPAGRRRRFTGRDPGERHRASTPLELLYDLTIVVAFGTAADELAHQLAEGHARTGIIGFCFAAFAVSWAWLQYTWFASAYDTDDWVFRLATMVQMGGVVVISLGLPQVFASLQAGGELDNRVVVAGYVIMRLSYAFLLSLVARHDPGRRRAARTYLTFIGLAQAGWIATAVLDVPVSSAWAILGPLYLLELAGPFLAERRAGTPWHAHHIAERYSLLVIITLGEVIIGTVASLNAVVHGEAGWSVDAALLGIAGIGLCFACWWTYFTMPWGDRLHGHRERGFVFGYGHLVVFGALAAMGAGLHVAAYVLEGEAEIGRTATLVTVALPVAVFLVAFSGLSSYMQRGRGTAEALLALAAAGCVVLAVVLVAAGASIAVALLVLVLAPVTFVLGFEALGRRPAAGG